MYSRTIALPCTVAPASTTPKPSIRQRFASSTARCGMRSIDAFEMKSTTAFVAPAGKLFPFAGSVAADDDPACRESRAVAPAPIEPRTGVATAAWRNSLRVHADRLYRRRSAHALYRLAWSGLAL